MAESELTAKDDLREEVRRRYAEAAKSSGATPRSSGTTPDTESSSCCGERSVAGSAGVFGATLYGEGERTEAALGASLGCGNPTAVADLHEGEIVLDLGSGAGGDVLLSARRVGPSGRVYGLDMTDEMLALARANAADAGLGNVEFLKGEIEDIPLADGSVDVVISNCVINLSGDKPTVLREAFRVLRPGGRFAVSDVIADEDMDEATRSDMAQWTGCIAGALTAREFREGLAAARFEEIELTESHRVHASAASAIVRARRPETLGDPPLACSLSGDAMADRLAELGALFRQSLLGADRDGATLSLQLRDSPEVEERLARLVELERACCPFLEIELERRGGCLQLRIEAPAGAEAVIDGFAELASTRP